ncbi:MAG: DUF2306 domain-containing protein [Spirosomaceae bacterium]|jgi:uncharacterized membrane protein|nr:DUF2306 domain-containing protein [Spirosomataceae bacterium]
MNTVFTIFLALHIASGTIGLLLGTFIMFKPKGDSLHKKLGRIFAVSMILTGLCAFILAYIHPNNFLIAVGIFTIYLTATSWRYLRLKNLNNNQKPLTIDWFLMIFMVLGSIWFLKLGVQLLLLEEYFGIIHLLFAWRGLTFAYQDYKTFSGKITTKNYWLLFHLQRMIGAYIAALTAFLVVNTPDRVSFISWLLPSVVLIPLIIKWSRRFKK